MNTPNEPLKLDWGSWTRGLIAGIGVGFVLALAVFEVFLR